MQRHRLVRVIGLLIVVLLTVAQAVAQESLVYVGTYTGTGSEGIYACRFNAVTAAVLSDGGELQRWEHGRVPDRRGWPTWFPHLIRAGGRIEPDPLPEHLPGHYAGNNTAVEIVIDQARTFPYVSNRGHDSGAAFHVDPGSGRLLPTALSLSVVSPASVCFVAIRESATGSW